MCFLWRFFSDEEFICCSKCQSNNKFLPKDEDIFYFDFKSIFVKKCFPIKQIDFIIIDSNIKIIN